MKIKSFGCSFIHGDELSSPLNAWPALIAQDHGWDYQCHAVPGSGNLQIMESILRHSDPGSLSIINWTWIDRFDFVNSITEQWETLRPALDHQHAEYYFRNLHGQYRDMLTNLCYVKTALDFLIEKNIKFVMTAVDDLFFEVVKKEWHDPAAVSHLQSKIQPYLQSFEGQGFLSWSRSNGYQISDAWHPLEDAHRAAADLFIDTIRRIA